MTAHPIKNNQIRTDDLAFSAYLRMKGYRLIKSDRIQSKCIFTFDGSGEDEKQLQIQFMNSEFLNFYNELRNLKKLF